MTRPAYVHIDALAFTHNLLKVRQFASQSKILAIVKANAYGHGVKHFVEGLKKTDAIGVSCIEEALELRELGITLPIVLLEGFFSQQEYLMLAQHNFASVIHHQQQLDILLKTKTQKPIKIWLKLNSGMNRLGFSPENFTSAWKQIVNCQHVLQPPILMSHFACADEFENTQTQLQIDTFNEVIHGLQGEISLANSAGIMGWPQSHYDWVRPGIMLYGISPFADKNGVDYGLKPVMTLRSEIIAINTVQKGEKVGYGATWIASKESLIGIVAMGYADGYPHHIKQGAPVLVNGSKTSLIGRVSMDMLAVDLTQLAKVKVGDPVVLWGEGLPVEKIAHYADTIAYELVCGINKRVHPI